ncbi:MAG TPA: DUF5060 domain-containing protein [Tepidisphaeraceae bacterium]|nr:DUF5060 domain-containing protein [Tepidisphaeraceae bacterium]
MPVETWDFYEITLKGPAVGNPFVEVELSARFSQGERSFDVGGFYDGEGVYRIRFMPDAPGVWRYETRSNRKELNGQSGSFEVAAARGANHGPVRVVNTFHFTYADGTPYRQIGTTCYAWTHQGDVLEEQTLAALKQSPFNKVRMCVFPKNYAFNSNDPDRYPFEGTPPNKWDTTRFHPQFFQHLEKRIGQLRDLGIEADIILFHPYDEGRWGFDRMDEASDDRYLKYIVARLSAFRNVWWSMANEFDFMKAKKPADWDRYFQVVQKADPYNHLRSIHNGRLIYDHNKPWVTHVSIQNGSAVEDFGRAAIYRDVYCKPIVFDEVKYEGDIPQRWGDLPAEEMVHRFWQGTIAGTYVGHGETYRHEQDIIWWARGGKLHGKSPARITFLKDVLDSSPAQGIDPIDKWQDHRTAGLAGEYYLVYFGKDRPTEWLFELPRAGLSEGMAFGVEIIDTWNMTITPANGVFKIVQDGTYRYHAAGLPKIKLPGNPYIALRIRRQEGDKVQFKEEERIYGES